jgi:hypothetical protein
VNPQEQQTRVTRNQKKNEEKKKDPNHYTGSQQINGISTTQEARDIVNNPNANTTPQQKRTKERTI